MQEIRLGSTNSVFSVDNENTVHVKLDHTTKKIPFTNVSTIVDQYEVYRSEASACNKYRLTLTMKPYCTNVLFNTCTEIVQNNGGYGSNESGSPKVKVALDNTSIVLSGNESNNVCGKTNGLTRAYMMDNTEYSSENVGFSYYPGYDIFGNHILRNLSFRSVIPLAEHAHTSIYNTIEDTMRNLNGGNVKIVKRLSNSDTNFINKHLYETTNILSMENGDSVTANLTNENGWYGFYNNSSIVPKRISNPNLSPREMDSNHVVNDKGNCEFVDMYPDRTLYSFTPKKNKYRNRLEYNWDIHITYPYENFYRHNLITNVYAYGVDTEQVNYDDVVADGQTNALLIMEATSQYCRNGMDGVQFRTFCKHNLKQNDYVILYYSTNYGQTFKACSSTFRVNYVGDMNNEHEDYYFTITNTSILDEIFDGSVASIFYEEPTNVPPAHFRNLNGEINEIPQELDTSDETYEPNICRWYYNQINIEPMVSWDSTNTVDQLPYDVINGPDFVRIRKTVNNEFTYVYYHYNGNTYQMLPTTFNPITQKFGDGNTFDDIPIGYVTDYIRVHSYTYYEKKYEYYIQKAENVTDIINNLLCNYIPLRFAKVVGGMKCRYYIRRFKKLPNLNKVNENLTDSIAMNRIRFEEYVQKNATKNGKMRNFDVEIYPLAFSKTIYGDDITQYQFTESIDISHLRDNLGRPLTTLYATIVKKNVGYKDWYADNIFSDHIVNNELHRVEFSHCFGKVTSALEYMCEDDDDSDRFRKNKGFLSDAKLITNDPGGMMNGNPLEFWGNIHMNAGETDGILEDDEVFFGDVVEYNPSTVMETVLSDVQFRFNTAQRENGQTNDFTFTYKEIVDDDYSPNDFSTIEHTNERPLIMPEGYYYKAHYPIPVRSFGDAVRQASHYSVLVESASPIQMDGIYIRIVTKNIHGYSSGRKIFICNDAESVWYNSSIVYVDSEYSFIINPIRKNVEAYEGKPYLDWVQTCNLINNETLRIRVGNLSIPDYADNVSTNLFLWRDVIPASESDNETLNTYPFANGALYIDRCINFYLKRQDPEGINGLYYHGSFPDIEGRIQVPSNYEYIPETEVTC